MYILNVRNKFPIQFRVEKERWKLLKIEKKGERPFF